MKESNLPLSSLLLEEAKFKKWLKLPRANKEEIFELNLADTSLSVINFCEINKAPLEKKAAFVWTMARLVLAKIRLLLPDLNLKLSDESEADRTLRTSIFAHYRAQARAWQDEWGKSPMLPGPAHLRIDMDPLWPKITVTGLAGAMEKMCAKVPVPLKKHRHLRQQGKKVQECMAEINLWLEKMPQVMFSKVVSKQDKQTIAVSLLAALELVKAQRATCSQSGLFEDIEIEALKSTQSHDSGFPKN